MFLFFRALILQPRGKCVWICAGVWLPFREIIVILQLRLLK